MVGGGYSVQSESCPSPVSIIIRLLPSRVGFAERDASRPAFGGGSLLSRIRHTFMGVGPLGPRMYVPAS